MSTASDRSDVGAGPGSDFWVNAYRQMLRIRLFEEQVNELYTRALMPGLAHLYSGEEAIAVGICEALTNEDYITSTHRGHGHCLAKGASPDKMFAELLGKEAGASASRLGRRSQPSISRMGAWRFASLGRGRWVRVCFTRN